MNKKFPHPIGDGPKKMLEDNPELPPEYIELLNKNKKFIEEMALADLNEDRPELLDSEINRLKEDRKKTIRNKDKFISEIKRGLGEEIRSKPYQVEFVQYPWHYKISKFIKNVFKKI